METFRLNLWGREGGELTPATLSVSVILLSIFFYGSTALYGPGPPRFVEVSWSHTLDTPQSVELLWTRDQLIAETST
jgi:hypothetical protein